jgi:hypothetical protein
MVLVNRPCTTGLAAATAGIVTLSLITPPPHVDVASSRVEVHPVQLAAATTAEISTTAVNTAVKVASAVPPASAPIPVAASRQSPIAHAAASIQQAPSATLATGTVSAFITDAARFVVEVGFGAVWYIAFPITLPLSYLEAVKSNQIEPNLNVLLALVIYVEQPVIVANEIFPPAPTASSTSASVQSSATVSKVNGDATRSLPTDPSAGPVGPLSVGAPAAASAATASEVKTTPLATKFARLLTTTLTTLKAQIGAAAPIPRTVAPKPMSFAVNSGPVVGTPQVSRNAPTAHPGPLGTALKSMTSNLNNGVKHAIGTISKKAQN